MKLPLNLTKKFSKALAPAKETNPQPKSLLGTVVKNGDNTFVILDGSSIETPVELAVDAEDGDRVAVQIKDHKATVVSNYSAPPSARTATNFMQLTEEGLVIAPSEDSTDMQLLLKPDRIIFRYFNGTAWVNMLSIYPGFIDRAIDKVIWDDLVPGLPSPVDPAYNYEHVDYKVTVRRCDKIIQMRLALTSNRAVGPGENIFEGNITATGCSPAQYATGVGYYGQHAIIGRISPGGSIVVRNASSSNVTVSDEVILSFTYILDESDM